MRIVVYGNFSVSWSSESHHANSLESLGHTVVRLQEGGNSLDRLRRKALQCDLLIWIHSHGVAHRGLVSMDRILQELRQNQIPSVAYHLDLFYGIPERWKEYQSDPYMRCVDHFFTVDKPMADWLNDHSGVRAHYMPPGVFHAECYLAPTRNPFDVAFVGSKRYHPEWPYRPRLIDWLTATYGSRFQHVGQDALPVGRVVRGKDLNQLYADAKVVVGDSFCPGFNYGPYFSDRVTETLGRGGFLIHPRCGGIEELFEDRKHLVLYDYNDWDGLKKLIDYYLIHDDEREKIRLAGHEYVKHHHTYRHRWITILNTVFGTPISAEDLARVKVAVESVIDRKVKVARSLRGRPDTIEIEFVNT